MDPQKYQNYGAFAQALYNTGIISDPWIDGRERFSLKSTILSQKLAQTLTNVAQRVAFLHQELALILLNNPHLIDEFYNLTPCQKLMWESSGGLWHGIARADLFVCKDNNIVCCELNSDTPSGQPEAVYLNSLLAHQHGNKVVDPNKNLSSSYINMLKQSHTKRTNKPLQRVGIIYPTELTEDLAMITLFQRWLENEGIKVITGSPFNLYQTVQGIELFGEPIDLIIRHYKTDWWGERIPIWTDLLDYPDPEPLIKPLTAILSAENSGQLTVVNPFGSVITQNKFSLAFFWEKQEYFSPKTRTWINKHIPETYRLTTLSKNQLSQEKEKWVIKSDYGCEGIETICGPFVSQNEWDRCLELAIPEHFVAQRFFQAKLNKDNMTTNYGVYLIGGTAAGYFTRMSQQTTDCSSITTSTFIESNN